MLGTENSLQQLLSSVFIDKVLSFYSINVDSLHQH